MATLDTLTIARNLTDAGADPKLAEAITAAVRQAAEHDNAAEPLATKRDLAELKTSMVWAMLIQTGVIVGATVALLRTLTLPS